MVLTLERTIPKHVSEQEFSLSSLLNKMQPARKTGRVFGAAQLVSSNDQILIYHRKVDDEDILIFRSGYVKIGTTHESGKNRTTVFFLPDLDYFDYGDGERVEGEQMFGMPFLVPLLLFAWNRRECNVSANTAQSERAFDERYQSAAECTALDRLIAEENVAEIRALLTAKERDVIDLLIAYPHRTVSEIAAFAGIARTTIESRLSKIRKKIANSGIWAAKLGDGI